MGRLRWERIYGDQAGLTLIELLGVAVIMIVLSLMALPVYAGVTDRARSATSNEERHHIEVALERFQTEYGKYPDRLGELVSSGLLRPTDFRSPWNNGWYYYAVNNNGRARWYILGEPGPSVVCGDSGAELCGTDPNPDIQRNRTPVLRIDDQTAEEAQRVFRERAAKLGAELGADVGRWFTESGLHPGGVRQ